MLLVIAINCSQNDVYEHIIHKHERYKKDCINSALIIRRHPKANKNEILSNFYNL